MKGRALLFGLNYAHCKQGQLNGCINDVRQMAAQIYGTFGASFSITVYTDDVDIRATSYNGIIQKLYDLAIASYKENLEFVWIHYSGHGSHQKDANGDESDGYDEGLVPSDYETRGLLLDDFLNRIMEQFNPKTRVLFITDCCHSGSILDLRYTWNENKQPLIENRNCIIKAPVILISSCLDSQTAADAFNLLKDGKHIGALTASIINVLNRWPRYIYNAFMFVNAIRQELKNGGFEQYPCLSSTYDLIREPNLIPYDVQAPKLWQQTPQYPANGSVANRPVASVGPNVPQYPTPNRPPAQINHSIPKPSYCEAQNTYVVSNEGQYPPGFVPLSEQITITYVPFVQSIQGYGFCV
jgi:hypothetical protein